MRPAGEPKLPMPPLPEPAPTQAAPSAAPVAPAPQSAAKQALTSGRRLSWRLRAAAYAVLALTIGGVAWLGTMLIYYTIAFPNPLAVRAKEHAPIIRIVARDGTALATRGAAHDYVPIDMIPQYAIDAVVATEDRRFFVHWGIDPAGLVRASFANLRAGRFVQGGSTLTQQLAKNLFLTSERTVSRKLDELALAFWLEVRLSKREILELYLNRVYFGGGAYGIEAAAQRYFDKSVRALSVAEAALIAGLLKAPSKYSPTSNPHAAIARGRSVLGKMRDSGAITAAVYRQAVNTSVRFADLKGERATTGFEYAIDLVLERLPPILGTEYSEMIVETTIDAALQTHANGVVAGLISEKGKAHAVTQAALVAMDTDGGVRALIGGRSFADSQFNRATKARRQPGSVFKPFVYLTALERGMKPDTVTYDLPITIDNWSPRNENNQHIGALTLRQALSQSVNTVAVRLATDSGLSAVAEAAQRLGIQSELRQDPSIALGTSEMSLFELVGAYGVFAVGGQSVEPHIIRRVRLNTGRVLFAHAAPAQRRVVAEADVGAMNDMLNAALVAGTGRRAALPRHPAAGKTGTTQDHRDAWFIGYTAHMTTGVWLGNDDGTPMRTVMGGNLPAEIWRAVMLQAHRDATPTALPGTSPLSADALHIAAAPIARSQQPELLPWQSQRRPEMSAYAARGPGSRLIADLRKKSAAPAIAPAPSRLTGSKSNPALAAAAPARPQVGQRMVVEPPAPSSAPGPISEDVFARLLTGPQPPAAITAGSGFDANAIRRQLDTLPDAAPRTAAPRGLMALGGKR